MNPKQFGKIIKSLRQERIDWQTMQPWTQTQLAQGANLSTDVIKKIEQGKRAKLASTELRSLADALKLSTLERDEFMAMANRDEDAVNIDPTMTQSAWDYAWQTFSTVQAPAYLIDSLYNLIGANRAFMAYRGLTDELLDKASQTEIGCNVLTLLFRGGSMLRKAMAERWKGIARSNLHHFRYTALRYRHLSAFERLTDHLRTQPDFTQLWLDTREHGVDLYSQNRRFEYHHATLGPLHYVTTLGSTLTRHGPLYTVMFVACDEQTQGVFGALSAKSRGARTVMEWPSPNMDE